MGLIAVGVSFRSAPLEVREKLVVSSSETAAFLRRVAERGDLVESVILSTCNRTELYAMELSDRAEDEIWEAFSERIGVDARPYGYLRRERDAVAHLYRVASGMDSMILGEAQIMGQVRGAWEASREFAGVALNRLFQSAAQVGSRVRESTGIGRGAASVSSASVQLAKQIFGSLRGRRAMVLGAGEMAELALECLLGEGVRAAIVTNRSFPRAQELAQQYGARAMLFDECWTELSQIDLLICSTAAPHAVVTLEKLSRALRDRSEEPLCILDIALPRDVDPAVRQLKNVFLYDVDDLWQVVTANLERRTGELPSAEAVIEDESERYWRWLAGLKAVPVLTQFRAEMERLRQHELDAALRRMRHLDPADRESIELFSRSLMNKFLHNPSIRLREAASNGRGLGVIDAAHYLFALGEERSEDSLAGSEVEDGGGRDGAESAAREVDGSDKEGAT